MACNNQYIVQDCCDSSNSFRVGDICITGLTNGDIFYTECSGLTTGSTSFTFSGCVVVNSSAPILANAADTFSALTSYTACTNCQTAISGTPCPTPTPTVTPTTTNTSGLIYLTGQMSLPATLTVGMVVTDSSGNCWEIIATTGTTPNLTWGNQIFPVGGCASCLVVNPCPTLTPTVTPTNTPTNTVTPTVTPTSLGCLAYNIQVNTGISGCTFTYIDCSGATQTVTITSGNSNTVCSLTVPTTSCGASAYTITNIGNCCQTYNISVIPSVNCTFTYVDCSGVTQTVTVTGGTSTTVCSLTIPTTPCPAGTYTIINQGFCCLTYNINVNSNVTGCTFSYINCSGSSQTVTITSGLSLSLCSIITPTTSCPPSAYTMSQSGTCCSYYNLSVVNTSCTFSYIDCSGNSQSVVVTSATSTSVCSQVIPTTSCNPTGYTITSASTCNPCVTYTITNNNSVPYTFSYIDCSGVTQTITVPANGGVVVICTLTIPTAPKGVAIVAGGNCCQTYNINVGSGVSGCTFTYTDCSGNTQTVTITSGNSTTLCAITVPTTSCGTSAYTMTTIGTCCTTYNIQVGSGVSGCTFTYIDCSGSTQTVTITSGNSNTVCALSTPTTSCGVSAYTITNIGSCCQSYTLYVDPAFATSSACTFSYIDCSGSSQSVSVTTGTPVTVCSLVVPSTSCPPRVYTITNNGYCCTNYILNVNTTSACTFNYINCSGFNQSITVNSGVTSSVCSIITPTTSCPSSAYTINITGNCIPSTCYYVALQPGGLFCYVDYTDPISGFTTVIINSATTIQLCSTTVPVASSVFPICSPSDIAIIAGSACTYNATGSTWDCPTESCKCWDIYISPPTNCTVPYVDCYGIIQFYALSGGTTGNTVCSPYKPVLYCGALYTATTSGLCSVAISGVYECVPCLDYCIAFGNGNSVGTLYNYDVNTNTSAALQVSTFFDDVANTSNYYWTNQGNTINEYPWTGCPVFTSGSSRTINITGFTGSLSQGFCAINDTTLVAIDNGTNNIYELDITTTNAVETLKISNPAGRIFDGDIAYTTGNMLLTITSGVSGYYITQFDYTTGAQDLEVAWSGSQKPQAFLFNGGQYPLVIDFTGGTWEVSYTAQTYLYNNPIAFPTTSQDPLCCTATICTGNTFCSSWLRQGSDPYLYDVSGGTTTNLSSIFTSGFPYGAEGIALSDGFYFVKQGNFGGDIVRQYAISPCNNYAGTYRDYQTDTGANISFAAIDDYNVLVVDGISQNLKKITLDPNTLLGTSTTIFNFLVNQPNRFHDYDLVYTTFGKILSLNQDNLNPGDFYLTQLDYTTGAVEVDVFLSGITSTPFAILVDNGNLYVVDTVSKVYSVQLTSPYNVTLYQTLGISINSGAQRPSCVNVLLV